MSQIYDNLSNVYRLRMDLKENLRMRIQGELSILGEKTDVSALTRKLQETDIWWEFELVDDFEESETSQEEPLRILHFTNYNSKRRKVEQHQQLLENLNSIAQSFTNRQEAPSQEQVNNAISKLAEFRDYFEEQARYYQEVVFLEYEHNISTNYQSLSEQNQQTARQSFILHLSEIMISLNMPIVSARASLSIFSQIIRLENDQQENISAMYQQATEFYNQLNNRSEQRTQLINQLSQIQQTIIHARDNQQVIQSLTAFDQLKESLTIFIRETIRIVAEFTQEGDERNS